MICIKADIPKELSDIDAELKAIYHSKQYLWECPHCKNKLKPKKGVCCVYCSYGSVKCPPIQKGECY